VKENLQLPEGHPVAKKLGEMVLGALARSPLFMSAALPLRVFPPMFDRYTGGGHLGTHVDTAIRSNATTGQTIRTDASNGGKRFATIRSADRRLSQPAAPLGRDAAGFP